MKSSCVCKSSGWSAGILFLLWTSQNTLEAYLLPNLSFIHDIFYYWCCFVLVFIQIFENKIDLLFRFPFTFALLFYSMELDILQLTKFLRRSEERLCLGDTERGLEIFFFPYRFRGKRRAERSERSCIDYITLRTKLVEYLTKLIEYGCNIRLTAGSIFRPVRSQSFSNEIRCFWQTGLAMNNSFPFIAPTLILRKLRE